MPFWLLISDGNGSNEMMAPSERSRCPQTHPISMFSPRASDRGVFSLKIDHRQCHFLRTVIYHLITSGYSFPSENFLEVFFCFLLLLPFFLISFKALHYPSEPLRLLNEVFPFQVEIIFMI